MKIINTALVLSVIAAGVYLWPRPHSAPLSDLRNAVADDAMGDLRGVAGGLDMDVPAPTGVQRARVSPDENDNILLLELKGGDIVQFSEKFVTLAILRKAKEKDSFLFAKGKLLSSPEDIDVFYDPPISGRIKISPEYCVGESRMAIASIRVHRTGVSLGFGEHSCVQRIEMSLPSTVPFSNATLGDFAKALGGHCRIIPKLR
ncbi:MAG TPA: hypothetical protein DCZ93_00555 [Elusimicrobia bacterium]|nr:hypothetical protein [Elusimicrobiota bacterium]